MLKLVHHQFSQQQEERSKKWIKHKQIQEAIQNFVTFQKCGPLSIFFLYDPKTHPQTKSAVTELSHSALLFQ